MDNFKSRLLPGFVCFPAVVLAYSVGFILNFLQSNLIYFSFRCNVILATMPVTVTFSDFGLTFILHSCYLNFVS